MAPKQPDSVGSDLIGNRGQRDGELTYFLFVLLLLTPDASSNQAEQGEGVRKPGNRPFCPLSHKHEHSENQPTAGFG